MTVEQLRQRLGLLHAYRQRHYVLFGVEVDRDVDATDVAVHLWPVTCEWERPRVTMWEGNDA